MDCDWCGSPGRTYRCGLAPARRGRIRLCPECYDAVKAELARFVDAADGDGYEALMDYLEELAGAFVPGVGYVGKLTSCT